MFRPKKRVLDARIRNKLRIFQTTQCSHCSRFYTQPFLCPDRRMRSSCVSFNKLNEEERRLFLGDKKWWWRITDMLQQVQEKGIMAKCRKCGALNPNPQQTTCWQCKENNLCCPHCREAPYLRYSIEDDFWKCPSAGCGKKIGIKKKAIEEVLSHEICKHCSNNLHYDPGLLLWRCRRCKNIYTSNELHKKQNQRTKGDISRLKYKKILEYRRRKMLKIPIRLLVGLSGLWGVLLGAHGLYTYFSPMELLFGGKADQLFLTLSVPERLGVTVTWMSLKSLESWFIPIAIFIVSWVIVSRSGLWPMLAYYSRKSKLF